MGVGGKVGRSSISRQFGETFNVDYLPDLILACLARLVHTKQRGVASCPEDVAPANLAKVEMSPVSS